MRTLKVRLWMLRERFSLYRALERVFSGLVWLLGASLVFSASAALILVPSMAAPGSWIFRSCLGPVLMVVAWYALAIAGILLCLVPSAFGELLAWPVTRAMFWLRWQSWRAGRALMRSPRCLVEL